MRPLAGRRLLAVASLIAAGYGCTDADVDGEALERGALRSEEARAGTPGSSSSPATTPSPTTNPAGSAPPSAQGPAQPQQFSLRDSLKGSTKGNLVGGSIGPSGWTTSARSDRLWYEIPTLVEGSIQFVLSGVSNANLVEADNDMFAMYEAGYGMTEPVQYAPQYRENHFKAMIRVYGGAEPARAGQQKLMWGMCPSGAPGYGACGCGSFFEEPFGGDGSWDGTPQTMRVEWKGKKATLTRNGAEVVSIDWSNENFRFGPQTLHFSLGTSRDTVALGAVYSDLVVEGTTGEVTTCANP